MVAISTTPAAGMATSASSRVVQDHVERAAVVGYALNRLEHLVLGRQQQRRGVEILRTRAGRVADLRDARDNRPCLPEHAGQEPHDDRQHDEEQHEVADPPERHRGLRSATIAALRAIPGSALRITSNWALMALTAGSSGRRCSASTDVNAEPSVASPLEIDCRRRRTSISATASTAITTTASKTLSSTRRWVVLMRHLRSHR